MEIVNDALPIPKPGPFVRKPNLILENKGSKGGKPNLASLGAGEVSFFFSLRFLLRQHRFFGGFKISGDKKLPLGCAF